MAGARCGAAAGEVREVGGPGSHRAVFDFERLLGFKCHGQLWSYLVMTFEKVTDSSLKTSGAKAERPVKRPFH